MGDHAIFGSHTSMRFNTEELIVIFKALKMNYLDGPDNEEHEKQLSGLLTSIANYLGYIEGLTDGL